MTARIKKKYREEVVNALKTKLGLTNSMAAPRLVKIILNMGIRSSVDKDVFKALVGDLGKITGQRPVVTKARRSISNFKVRQGMPVGAKVTLRGDRMYEFMDRLVSAALPRIRDFRGVTPSGFDGRGNYAFGISDQTVFPEIDPDEVKTVQGMDIVMVTSARTNEAARELLQSLGMPFASAKEKED